MDIKPINNKVIVMMDERDSQVGGIHLPEKAQKAPEWGEVVRVGPTAKHLAEGDRVYIPSHMGSVFANGGREYVVIEDHKVIGKEVA